MDLNVNVCVDLSDRVANLLTVAFSGILKKAGVVPEPEKEKAAKPVGKTPPPETKTPPQGDGDTSEIIGAPDYFVSDKEKREWLVKQLTECGVDIPTGTRTQTLIKKWNVLAEANAKAGGPSLVTEAPPVEPSDTALSKDEVINRLTAWIMDGGKTPIPARRDEVTAKINGLGAKVVADLDPKHYAELLTVIGA